MYACGRLSTYICMLLAATTCHACLQCIKWLQVLLGGQYSCLVLWHYSGISVVLSRLPVMSIDVGGCGGFGAVDGRP